MQESDYQQIIRTKDQSVKYFLAHTISYEKPQDLIVLSYADMDFKVPDRLYQKLIDFHKVPHFGYCVPSKSIWKVVSNWINKRYNPDVIVDQITTIFWTNTLTTLSGVINTTTKPNDQVLIFCPTYYKFIEDIRAWDRKCVQFELDTVNNTFKIDFQKLQNLLKTQNIKLLIFANPWNPIGKIWSHSQLAQLKDLVIKYNIYIYSDQIFSDSVQPVSNFTSMLQFVQQLSEHLIYCSSHSKTMNCSGMTAAYSITYNRTIAKKLDKFQISWTARPTVTGYAYLELSYSDPQFREWAMNTHKYIQSNYNLFKKLCSEQGLQNLKIYQLQCSFLMLVDFCQFPINFKNLRQYFRRVNVCPTFMDITYEDNRPTPLVRLNIACNKKVIEELVQRLKQMVKMAWIE